jgi:predicted GNAT family acetyltransferase
MKITQEDMPGGGRYVTEVDGHQAEMTYSRQSPEVISIDHTGVPDSLRGRGIAQALALHAVEDARKEGWKIVPRCSFFKAQAERHPEWRDVLK